MKPGSLASSLYAARESMEDFYCNYGLNPEFIPKLESAGLTVGATSDEDDVRIVELRSHPFFVGTLFLPQTRSSRERPHPILRAFEQAVLAQAASN
jgi:CTP synthase (UTP-ammonia lyase)